MHLKKMGQGVGGDHAKRDHREWDGIACYLKYGTDAEHLHNFI